MRILRYFLAVYFIPLTAVFAAPVQLQPASINPPDVSAQIGVAAAVRGTVQLSKAAQVGTEIKNGQPIFLGDVISTDEKGNLQILLLDQTIFTIGPNSSIVIDKFIYDPSTQSGKVNAKILKGVFRFVTGKIGQKNPQDMNVDLPAGTIGIRGTIVAGEVTGMRSNVILLGPGEKNNTGSRQGRILVSANVNGQPKLVLVNRSGFGTTIEGENQPPSRPFRVPAEMMNRITQSLSVTSEDSASPQAGADAEAEAGETSGESATEESGQGTAGAIDSVQDNQKADGLFNNLSDESDNAAQQSLADENAIFDGISTFGDLTKVQLATATYSQTGIPLYDTNDYVTVIGSYDIDFKVDFQKKSMGGNGSTISGHINGGGNTFSFDLGAESFGALEDPAIVFYDSDAMGNNNAPLNTGSSNCSTCTLDAVIIFNNGNDSPGQSITHVVEIGGVSPDGYGAGAAAQK